MTDSASTNTRERVALAFQERYWADEAEGSIGSLADYVTLWPEHELVIAREYMTLRSAASTADRSDTEGLDRIGPYVLEDEIGRGGQGLVYRAKDERLGRTVALKILTGLGPGAEKQIARFKREAEVAARLEHPGICGVHDAGVENGVPYIAMRFVEGETLQQRISRTRQESMTTEEEESFLDLSESAASGDDPLEDRSTDSITTSVMPRSQIDAILQVFEKAARALHAAHEAGVVHRDVKPGNIMITREGEPVLLDFGLAQDDSQDGHSLTMTGDLFGTPAYMSPEQIAGHRIQLDGRSDVYALGVTLHESLTLRRPWEAPTREALYQAIMTKDAPDPRRLNRSISKDLKVVLECALEKDRDRRYSSAQAFADDLAAVREGLPVAASPIGPLGRAWRWSKRRPMRAALLVVLAIGIPLITGLSGFIFANLDEIEAQKKAEVTRKVDALLARGFFKYLAEDEEGRGRAEFAEALELSPGNIEATAGLALSSLLQRQREGALEVVRRTKWSLDDPSRLNGLEAIALRALKREEEARELEGRVPEPREAMDWFLAGLTQLNSAPRLRFRSESSSRKTRLRAVRCFERAVGSARRPRIAYHIWLAQQAQRAGDRSTALIAADALVALWPDEIEARFLAAEVRGEFDPAAALADYRHCLGLEPDHLPSRAGLAQALFRLRRRAEGMIVLDEARAMARAAGKTHMSIAMACSFINDYEGAHDEYSRILQDHPDDRLALHNIQGSCVELGLLDEALAHSDHFHELVAETAMTVAQRSRILLAMQRHEEAEATARRAIDLDESEPSAWRVIAMLRMAEGKREEMIEAARRALEGAPGHVRFRGGIADLLKSAGEADEALSIYRDLVLQDPSDVTSLTRLSQHLFDLGWGEEAVTHFERALEIDPDDTGTWANLVAVYGTLRRFDDAVLAFQKAIAIEPENAVAWANVACIHDWMGNRDLALESARKAVDLNGEKASYRSNLALMLERNDRIEEAIPVRREARRLDPQDENNLVELSVDLCKTRRLDEAIEIVREVLERRPDHAKAHATLGFALMQARRQVQAREHIIRSFELDPTLPHSIQNMLWAVGPQLERARELLATAVAGHPDVAALRISLANLLYRSNDLEGAAREARACLQQGENDLAALSILSASLMSLGEVVTGEEIMFRAQQIGRSSEESLAGANQGLKGYARVVQARLRLLLFDGRVEEAEALLQERLSAIPELADHGTSQEVIDNYLARSEAERVDFAVSVLAVNGRVYLDKGLVRAANFYHERIVKLDPTNYQAHNLIAWSLVDPDGDARHHDPQRALPHARAAAALTERANVHVLDTLAVTLAALRELTEAISVQEEILRLMKGKDMGSYKLLGAQRLLETYRAALSEKSAEDRERQ